MLEPLLGSRNAERVLVYVYTRKEGYAREIAAYYETSFFPIRQQLDRLELGGVLVSRPVGRTRLYAFNPRYPFLKELTALIAKAVSFYKPEERDRLTMTRRRPRRKGKPL